MPEDPSSPDGRREEFYLVGRVTVLASDLDELLYGVATQLGILGSRRVSGTTVASAIRSVVQADGLPCWASPDVTVERVLAWCSEARGALSTRSDIVHSRVFMIATRGQWVPHRKRTSGRLPPVVVRLGDYRRAGDRVDAALSAGYSIQQGLMIEIAPNVTISSYPPSVGSDPQWSRGKHLAWHAPEDVAAIVALWQSGGPQPDEAPAPPADAC